MARRGDGIYLRGLTWRLDFIHKGKRPIETFDLNEEGILHSTAKIELRLTWGLFQNPGAAVASDITLHPLPAVGYTAEWDHYANMTAEVLDTTHRRVAGSVYATAHGKSYSGFALIMFLFPIPYGKPSFPVGPACGELGDGIAKLLLEEGQIDPAPETPTDEDPPTEGEVFPRLRQIRRPRVQ